MPDEVALFVVAFIKWCSSRSLRPRRLRGRAGPRQEQAVADCPAWPQQPRAGLQRPQVGVPRAAVADKSVDGPRQDVSVSTADFTPAPEAAGVPPAQAAHAAQHADVCTRRLAEAARPRRRSHPRRPPTTTPTHSHTTRRCEAARAGARRRQAPACILAARRPHTHTNTPTHQHTTRRCEAAQAALRARMFSVARQRAVGRRG